MLTFALYALIPIAVLVFFGIVVMLLRCYRKVEQGTAIIRTGLGGTKVSFEGIVVIPVIHRMETMDICVKRVEIDRMSENGLVCRDNLRADVKVAFFVRVNKSPQDVLKVAQSLGCRRASDSRELVAFFDAKFSEALKTAGKQFDFVHLYTDRMRFKEEILKVVGTDLNGYVLDDAAIDYLEQTPVSKLDPNHILDAEGIKKITELTAAQAVLANNINRERERTIKRQDVETREKILELERQQAEAEQRQKREIAEVTARETAQAMRVQQEERLKAERARIATEEEVAVAEENKKRQIVVAERNRERTDKVEAERVEKDRALEATERERVVALSQIDRDKAVEVEKRAIAEVIRERVAVERTMVAEEEKIKDTRAFAGAERDRQVVVTRERAEAEKFKVKEVVSAEAQKEAAREAAEKIKIEADARKVAAERDSDARKTLADAHAQEEAVPGLGEARALTARADAAERMGLAEAKVIESKTAAEAQGIRAKALAEAEGLQAKAGADAEGITKKAEAMKLFHDAGRDHEEFKIRLNRDLQVELAGIAARKDIAAEQAKVLGEALKSAKIDIIGGDQAIFDRLVNAVGGGKALDRWVKNSEVLGGVVDALFEDGADQMPAKLKELAERFGVTSESVKNMSVAALLAKLAADAAGKDRSLLADIRNAASAAGLLNAPAAKFL